MVAALIMAAAVGLPAPIWGDFDHDGRRDRAGVVRSGRGVYSLVVWRGVDPKRPVVVDTMRDVAGFYLAKAPRGRFRTACGKGYDLGEPCRYRTVRVTGDVLDFGTAEASEAMAFWNGRRFEVVWMSD